MKKKIIITAVVLLTAGSLQTFASENIATLDDCFRAALKQSEVIATQQEVTNRASEH